MFQCALPLKTALPLLIGRLAAEENLAVQRCLIRTLGNIGPAAHPALALIYPKLEDPYFFRDALYYQLTTVDAPFRALAAETVGKLRLSSPEWISALTTATRSRDAQTRHALAKFNQSNLASSESAKRFRDKDLPISPQR